MRKLRALPLAAVAVAVAVVASAAALPGPARAAFAAPVAASPSAAAGPAGAAFDPPASSSTAGGPAGAAFGPPVELLPGADAYGVGAVSDGASTTTAVVSDGAGLELLAYPRGGAWSPLPAGVVSGWPALAAAGGGGLALAWRVDQPRKYGGIALAVRDPGGAALGAPQTVADDSDGGVRHPAVAMDRGGDVVLAYNTGTRASHLSARGGVAIVLRAAGGSVGEARIVDPGLSTPPAVAIGREGRGIVAWSRSRHAYAVTVDAVAGTVGKVTTLAGGIGVESLVAAAGPGGAATVAWVSRVASGTGRQYHQNYWIGVARRASGHRFAHAVKVGPTRDYLADVALADDEGGTATLAWSPRAFRPRATTTTFTATAAPGQPFGAPRVLVPGGAAQCSTPTIAATSGRAVLAWSCEKTAGHTEFQAATGTPDPGSPTTIATASRGPLVTPPPDALATLDEHGTATIFFVETEPAGSPTGGTSHLLTVTSDPTTTNDPR